MEVEIMQKFIVYFLLVISILIITGSCLAFSSAKNNENIEFLNSYGWEVKDTPIEKVNIKIPEAFDDVYENYNKIQKDAGLDLSPYKGKAAIRYTYEIINYPKNTEAQIRANIILVDNQVVAGDIMTTSGSVFMHFLVFPKP